MSDKKVVGFLKYIKVEHSSDFIKGNIYFNDIKNYNDIETKLIGDIDEGRIVHNKEAENHIIFFKVENSDERFKLPNLKSLKHSLHHPLIEKLKICCFTCIYDSDIEKIDKNEMNLDEINDETIGNIEGFFRLKSEYIESLPEYEDEREIYICNDMPSFFSDLKNNVLLESNAFMIHKQVNYYKSINPLFDKVKSGNFDLNDIIESAFQKDEKFEKQKEYRIMLINLDGNFIKLTNMNKYWKKIDKLENLNMGLLLKKL